MPLRTYRCTSCATPVDVLEPVESPAARACPCTPDGLTLERQVSAPGQFVLKGDGFYKPGAS